jgi:hypothetical protein
MKATHYIKIWHPELNKFAPALKIFRVDLRKMLTFKGAPSANVLEFHLPALALLSAFGVELTIEKIDA